MVMKRNFNTPFNKRYLEDMKIIHLNILEVRDFVR